MRELLTAPSSWLRQADTIPPPIDGGRGYDFRSDGLDIDMVRQIFESIDTKDAVLLRGLTTLLRASMLKNHLQFYEEGINTLFISLEASFRLVVRRLKEQGNPEPTAADAATFLHDTFNDVHRLEKYFEEDYERRIISFHPESRFGTFSSPPFFVDDFYFLFNDLLEVYRFLLIEYVHPMHKEKTKYVSDGANS
jgi:hypothetical protein